MIDLEEEVHVYLPGCPTHVVWLSCTRAEARVVKL